MFTRENWVEIFGENGLITGSYMAVDSGTTIWVLGFSGGLYRILNISVSNIIE